MSSEDFIINIEDFLPDYPEVDNNSDFYQEIFNKKEFNELILSNQEIVPNTAGSLMKHQEFLRRFISSKTMYDSILIMHTMGCLDPNTKVLKWNGQIVPAFAIEVGDFLIGDDGNRREVVRLLSGTDKMYRISQRNSLSYTVNEKHILSLKYTKHKNIKWNSKHNSWTLRWFDSNDLCSKLAIRKCDDISFEKGKQYIEDFANIIPDNNIFDISVKDYLNIPEKDRPFLKGFRASKINWSGNNKNYEEIYTFATTIQNEIPTDYIISSERERLLLLAGIIDTFGKIINTADGTFIEIKHSNENVCKQIIFIANSLGFLSNIVCNIIVLTGNGMEKIPLRTLSMISVKNDAENNVFDISIEYIGEGEYVGWELAGGINRRFLLEDFTVTHNSGKTCSSIGIIEENKHLFTGAIILAKNTGILKNYENELVFKCTDGRYIPENYDSLTEIEKTHRIRKSTSYYDKNTFEIFAKEINKLNDDIIRKKYSNKIIVIDEVHNLRPKEKEGGIEVYNVIHRFVHTVVNCKLIIMSGTPMKDGPEEFASIMNLLLPMSQQLPLFDKFLSEYMIKEGKDLYRLKVDKIPILKKLIKGRVSYLSGGVAENVTKLFIGKKMGELNQFIVEPDYMSQFQSQIYMEALKKDIEENNAWYNNARQAALMVFPDKTYGSEGFKKNIIKKGEKSHTYSLSSELENFLRADNDEERLEKLGKLSSKYAASIRNILKCRKHGKTCFVYNEFVEGSGSIVYSLILRLFGFIQGSGNEKINDSYERYALISGKTSTQKSLKKLINRVNMDDNMNGNIIRVIIGSKIISEGFTLKNIGSEDILTSHWNYSETDQVISRGYRINAHKALIESGITNPVVEIHQRVSIPLNNKTSVDLILYELSENKDVSMKRLERIIKEAAVDCSINYRKNKAKDLDGMRECEYQSCDYTCDGVDKSMVIQGKVPANMIDYSTYNLYYSDKKVLEIKNNIKSLFKTNFKLSFQYLFSQVKSKPYELLEALRQIINNSEIIMNKYGIVCYLKETDNIYYLVSSLSTKGKLGSDYYTRYPNLRVPNKFEDLLLPLYDTYMSIKIKEIENATTEDSLLKYMSEFTLDIQEKLLEAAILAKKLGIASTLRDLILSIFSNYYTKLEDNTWLLWLLYERDNNIKCLKPLDTSWDSWEICNNEEYENIILERKLVKVKDMEKNPYGFYGQINKLTSDFCIRDVRPEKLSEKKHKTTSGRKCNTWTKADIIEIVTHIGSKSGTGVLQTGTKEYDNYSRKKLLTECINDVNISSNFTENDLAKFSDRELKDLLSWGKQSVATSCGFLKKWMESKNLLIEDQGCGTSKKKKV